MKNLDKLLSWLQTSEYDGVILGRRDNFKWITEENANAVVTNTEVGVAHLLIEKDGSVTVAADSSDCPRMETEQNALRAKGMLIPWYESFEAHLKDYIGDRTFASDTGIVGTDNGVEIFTRTKVWPCSMIETKYGSCSVADILYIKNE